MNTNPDSDIDKKESHLVILELIIWFIIGSSFSVRPLFILMTQGVSGIEKTRFYDADFFTSLFIIIIPLLFRLIFGFLPFQRVRLQRARLLGLTKPDNFPLPMRDHIAEAEVDAMEQQLAFLASLAKSSEKLSNRIFTRAGVYLLVGVLIAFSGVAFFYLYEKALQSAPWLATGMNACLAQRVIRETGSLPNPQRPLRSMV